ncbi:uncharacterized protein [Epargyreus clarus]|uniref:uncharacterized protein n=1 Tax=Epargyreus clarus TaxID=520877 RepID=UPI003C2C5DB9
MHLTEKTLSRQEKYNDRYFLASGSWFWWSRTIVANKPDIVVIDRSERHAIIVDITVPHDENLVKAEKDKQFKYLDLAREVVDMWDVNTAVVVPIVVSANGLIAKSLDQHLRRRSLGSWIKRLIQKAVLLDTARIVRRFLSQEP